MRAGTWTAIGMCALGLLLAAGPALGVVRNVQRIVEHGR
jgi:hypothetical protein